LQRRALKPQRSAGLRIGSLTNDNKAASSTIGSLPKAEPRGQWNPGAVLRCGITQVQNDGGESGSLKQQVGGTQSLIKFCPRLFFAYGMSLVIFSNFRGGILAADPKELAQVYPVCSSRFGIEGIVCIDPRADPVLDRSLGNKLQREAGST
jgi:hypothetical protein